MCGGVIGLGSAAARSVVLGIQKSPLTHCFTVGWAGKYGWTCACSPVLGCDTVPEVGLAPGNTTSFVVIASSEGNPQSNTFTGQRLSHTVRNFATARASEKRTLTFNTSVRYQSIRGFGNAFTDSAAINFYKTRCACL